MDSNANNKKNNKISDKNTLSFPNTKSKDIVINEKLILENNDSIPKEFASNCLVEVESKQVDGNNKNDAFLKFARNTFHFISSSHNKNKTLKRSHLPQPNEYHDKLSQLPVPKPVQLRTWPILIDSRDGKWWNAMIVAPTGSGKTLAYGLPLVYSCMAYTLQRKNNNKGLTEKMNSEREMHTISQSMIYGLVLVPTRELAYQVAKEISTVISSAKEIRNDDHIKTSVNHIKAIAIYGGISRYEQKVMLSKKNTVYIVIATPGRLLDLLDIQLDEKDKMKNSTSAQSNINQINDCTVSIRHLFDMNTSSNANLNTQTFTANQSSRIIIDEADRMASNKDMSKQVDTLLKFLRRDNQHSSSLLNVSLFSATMKQNSIEKCNEWMPQTKRAMVYIDSLRMKPDKLTQEDSENSKDTNQSIDIFKMPPKLEKDGVDDENAISNQTETSKIKTENNKSVEKRKAFDLSALPSNLTQTLHVCTSHKKPKKLLHTLSKIRKDEIQAGRGRKKGLSIVFFQRIKTLNYIAQLMEKEGLQCAKFHSQLSQQLREKTIQDFRSGKIVILLSTDLAARGIHINNIEYVINYDFPTSLEEYIHRCGRAGRSSFTKNYSVDGKETTKPNAIAYSFFHRELAPMAADVVHLLQSTGAWIDPNLFSLLPKSIREKGLITMKETSSSRRRRNKKRKERENIFNGADECLVSEKESLTSHENPNTSCSFTGKDLGSSKDDCFSDEDEFAYLDGNRLPFK